MMWIMLEKEISLSCIKRGECLNKMHGEFITDIMPLGFPQISDLMDKILHDKDKTT